MMIAEWGAYNNGAGKRAWFLMRNDESLPIDERYHYNSNGDLVRYANYKTAGRAADKLNKRERDEIHS